MLELIIVFFILIAFVWFVRLFIKGISFFAGELKNYGRNYSESPDEVKKMMRDEAKKNFNGVALFHILRQFFK